MAGNLHPQEGIVNEQERARKREKNIKKRRRARVCIVVNFFKNFHLASPRLQESGGKGSKKCKNRVGTGENREPGTSLFLRFSAASRFQSKCRDL